MQEKIIEGLQVILHRIGELEKKTSFQFHEANTEAVVVEPILNLLGWRIETGEIYKQFPAKDETAGTKAIDYALILENKPRILIEAKALNHQLAEKEILQLRNYAYLSSVPWVVLTNGFEWSVHNADFKKEFFKFDIRKPEEDLNQFLLLHRDSVHAGTLYKAGEEAFTASAIDSYLRTHKEDLLEEILKSDLKLKREIVSKLFDQIGVRKEIPATPPPPTELEKYLEGKSENVRSMAYKFHGDMMRKYPNLVVSYTKYYVSYGFKPPKWTSFVVFVTMEPKTSFCRFDIKLGWKEVSEKKPIVEDISNWATWWKRGAVRLRLREEQDYDYLMSLIEKAYQGEIKKFHA